MQIVVYLFQTSNLLLDDRFQAGLPIEYNFDSEKQTDPKLVVTLTFSEKPKILRF